MTLLISELFVLLFELIADSKKRLFTEFLEMWSIKLQTYIVTLRTVYLLSTLHFHFLERLLLVPMSCRIDFFCFDILLLTLLWHWKFIFKHFVESLFELDNRTIFGFIS
jgi:hypothetical protein